MNALNGTVSGMSDTSSVNCLLDLDDEIIEKKDVSHKRNVFSFTNVVNNSGQDVYSVPDSGQETTSSFGSASSHGGNLLTNSVQKGQNKDHEDGGLVGLSGSGGGFWVAGEFCYGDPGRVRPVFVVS
ncbi:hypothetical protein Hdeb2414_s0135g00808581 [Helianthus debilis subsp. tardiflorus]